MSGLVGYGSSDEDEEDAGKVIGSDQLPVVAGHVDQVTATSQSPAVSTSASNSESSRQKTVPKIQTPVAIRPPSEGPLPGPALGPAFPPNSADGSRTPSDPDSAQAAYREVIQNLTLPTVPNFNIPPSPPGSPPPGVDAKIQQFLKLKKQGVHFNEKLASSSALKNPSLLGRLISNAGLSEEQQYSTSLPQSLWNPHGFEEWMFKESLEKARKDGEVQRQRSATGRARTAVDFVTGGTE